ncbi:hypothetical protein BS47DRAFT_1370552 [Hydnum rufescens UP504]|uniref:RRM domain-containing protein n=1 Tax=Hydnum rufescens UP504 TaxID=1448309 RepID=A0A9P6B944_9AGAM|nr:hypothetical protein BS47DRAFT_1370552 [Hydnum rufescens UP504]
MSRRLYLGRLPTDTQQSDVQKFFDGYGRIIDCRVMTGFGFVEFESSKEAEDIVQNFNGKQFLGQSIIVEFARENRRREFDGGRAAPPRDSRRDLPPPRARRPPGYRITVLNISRDTSWQDLKDFGREVGNVSFADVDRDTPGTGILEYLTQDDADDAVKRLDGKELRGAIVRVELADLNGVKDIGRDRERYRSPPRRSRSPPRRYYDRERSPYRRDEYRRRSRSPRAPPPRREDDRDHRRDRDDSYRRDDRDRGHRDPYDRRGDDREGGSSARY